MKAHSGNSFIKRKKGSRKKSQKIKYTIFLALLLSIHATPVIAATIDIFKAIEQGDLTAVQQAEGVELNARDKGDTPLLRAIKKNKINIAQTLLNNGANPNVEDNDGMTPLDYAADNCLDDLAELLISKGAYIYHEFEGAHLFMCYDVEEIIDETLEKMPAYWNFETYKEKDRKEYLTSYKESVATLKEKAITPEIPQKPISEILLKKVLELKAQKRLLELRKQKSQLAPE